MPTITTTDSAREYLGRKSHDTLIDRVMEIGDGLDCMTHLAVFDAEKTNALTIVRNIMGLTWANHHNNPANARRQGYRDSGLWYWYREGRDLRFVIQVGCACMRDCCGHLCRLSYTLQKVDDFFVVVTHKGFNF